MKSVKISLAYAASTTNSMLSSAVQSCESIPKIKMHQFGIEPQNCDNARVDFRYKMLFDFKVWI